ncbi:MAG: HD domain-containing phosphohydrolase [Prochlorothrix sp.]
MPPESTLNQLKLRLPNGQLPPSYGVYFKNTLVALCHAMEDHILQTQPEDPAQRPIVLVTFQRGKWYLQEAERYFDIAQSSQKVAIAALPDSGFEVHRTSQEDNVHLVQLAESDRLVEEWNLVIVAPGYTAMVLCHELSNDEYHADSVPEVDTERKFYGLWTFDRPLVEESAQILIDRMRPYNPDLAADLEARQRHFQSIKNPTPIDLTGVVSRIVEYLQNSQEHLVTVNRQTRGMWALEGQALRLNRNLTANKLQAFMRMAQRVDERDITNPVASLQVAALAETLGQLLDLPTLRLRRLRLAGLLFRIGLAEAPVEVFTRAASELGASDYAFWNDRALLGARLLSTMPELDSITHIVKHHLEYWDGSGRPGGLKEESIPLESRILCLVAYFQELTQERGDRAALSLNLALEKCQEYRGTRFDPSLVDSLNTVVRLTEMGMMQLPDRPSQMPPVWLEETADPKAISAS